MYFITCTESLPNERGDCGTFRTFGYYPTREEAEDALKENRLDMHEYLYVYAIIEKINPGIHPLAEPIQWFKFNKDKQRFERIDFKEEHSSNFALG